MIHHVMVIGYGIMGSGIARSFARGGHQVTVISRDPSRITNLPEGIFAVSELPHDPPDLIIEAIPEDIGLKNSLFAKLEEAYNGAAILATNTSGLSMETMSSELHYPNHFIGIHYFHPAELFPTVEVILTQQTAPETLGRVETALNRNGQQAVVLNRSIPGFLVNRLQHAMLHEAFSMIERTRSVALSSSAVRSAILASIAASSRPACSRPPWRWLWKYAAGSSCRMPITPPNLRRIGRSANGASTP